MNKTNKELAVDVAIEYIKGIYSQTTNSAGIQNHSLKLESCCNILTGVYNTLEKLDSDRTE